MLLKRCRTTVKTTSSAAKMTKLSTSAVVNDCVLVDLASVASEVLLSLLVAVSVQHGSRAGRSHGGE